MVGEKPERYSLTLDGPDPWRAPSTSDTIQTSSPPPPSTWGCNTPHTLCQLRESVHGPSHFSDDSDKAQSQTNYCKCAVQQDSALGPKTAVTELAYVPTSNISPQTLFVTRNFQNRGIVHCIVP